ENFNWCILQHTTITKKQMNMENSHSISHFQFLRGKKKQSIMYNLLQDVKENPT
ncbi:hypothetical protein TVAGG3_0688760, partial [Trichomonas vaginalis G3]|uniref:hypothetical protein n=1 Tax=Trichomonas vaginalis (strain ATCC PRA-98 / G3) TaxID=412133 RepID=UPI0021E58FBF